jgi:transposase
MSRPKKSVEDVQRRQFTMEFKREAVRQLESGEHSVSEVARRLGIRRENLYQWQQLVASGGLQGSRRTTTATTSGESPEQELRRLRKRVAQIEEEQEILGKAMAFFAKRHG